MKKKFRFQKKKFGSDTDTEIEPWFWFPILKPWFPIPKPGFGCTLQEKKIFERKWANFALWNYIQQKVRFMSLCWFSIHELAWRTGDLESCFAIFESSELVKVAKSQKIFSMSSHLHKNERNYCSPTHTKGQKISKVIFLASSSSKLFLHISALAYKWAK